MQKRVADWAARTQREQIILVEAERRKGLIDWWERVQGCKLLGYRDDDPIIALDPDKLP
jgi:hypothetical protein